MKKTNEATIWRDMDNKLGLTLNKPFYPEVKEVVGKPELPEPMTSYKFNEWIKTDIGKEWAKKELMKYIKKKGERMIHTKRKCPKCSKNLGLEVKWCPNCGIRLPMVIG